MDDVPQQKLVRHCSPGTIFSKEYCTCVPDMEGLIPVLPGGKRMKRNCQIIFLLFNNPFILTIFFMFIYFIHYIYHIGFFQQISVKRPPIFHLTWTWKINQDQIPRC